MEVGLRTIGSVGLAFVAMIGVLLATSMAIAAPPLTDEDCRRALILVLCKMVETGIIRIRMIELFSALNILNPDKHFKPLQVYQALQTMLRKQLFRAIEKNHGDPLVSRPNRRKLATMEEG